MTDNPTREALSDVTSWQAAKAAMQREAEECAKRLGHDPVLIRHEQARLAFGSASHGWRAEHRRKVLDKALAIATQREKQDGDDA
jgi:hypothetical protein